MCERWSLSMTLKPPNMPRPPFPPWAVSAFALIGPIGFLPPRLSKSCPFLLRPSSLSASTSYVCLKSPPGRRRETSSFRTCHPHPHYHCSSQRRMNRDADDDRSSSTPTAASKSVSGQEKEKPRLTDQEKKNNHIASEQKRRAAIREGFDRLTELVPGLEGQGRSESIVLQKTVDFIHTQLQERRDLIAEIENRGGRVDESLRPK